MTLNTKNTADVRVTWYFSVGILHLKHTVSHTVGGSDDYQWEYVHFLLYLLYALSLQQCYRFCLISIDLGPSLDLNIYNVLSVTKFLSLLNQLRYL